MRLLASSDYGRTFKVALLHPWKIGQCAMSTAAFSGAPQGELLAAWETQQQIYFSTLPDSAASHGAAAAVTATGVPGPGGTRKHPAVAANDKGEFIVAWTEGTGWEKGGAVAWQVFDPAGHPIPRQSGRAEGLPTWSAPAAFPTPDGRFKIAF
jgi:hypothetical protein